MAAKNEYVFPWPLANGALEIRDDITYLQVSPVDPSVYLEYTIEMAFPALINSTLQPKVVTVKNQSYVSQSNSVNKRGDDGYSFKITPVAQDLIIIIRY